MANHTRASSLKEKPIPDFRIFCIQIIPLTIFNNYKNFAKCYELAIYNTFNIFLLNYKHIKIAHNFQSYPTI